ncbi:DUF2690 domain-containing protein [Actinacidiphila glaucinigra]|uniref:helix-turn-helix domain-containing protein n=1 Tax=Actinacidiphila glaucinigra TaxID=235986 RepID=UPI0037C716E5
MDVQPEEPVRQLTGKDAAAELGRMLERWRLQANRTQQAAGAHLNASQGTVSRYEKAKTSVAEETVRRLWAYYKQPDDVLARALDLHRRASGEGENPPAATEPPAVGLPGVGVAADESFVNDTAPPAPAPGFRFTRKQQVAAAVAAVTLAALVVVGGVLATQGSGNSGSQAAAASSPTAVSAAPTAACDGASCVHVEPTTTVCQNDATTAFYGRGYGILVELRYSPGCRAAWAKMSNTSEGDRIQVIGKDQEPEEYRQQKGHNAHSRMVEAAHPGDARACAFVVDRGTVCATASASPGSAPTP